MTAPAGSGPTRLDRARADDLAARCVVGLRARGVRPGDLVAFTGASSPELLAAVLGCLRAGIGPVVMSAGLTPSELTSMLADVEPVLVVDDDLCRGLAGSAPDPDAEPLDDRFHCRPLHFTSGTSGRPKAVWSGWLDADEADGLWQEERVSFGYAATDEHWVCSPLSHSAPLRFALYTLLAGGAVHVPGRFDVDALRVGLAEGVTSTFMAPAQLKRLLDAGPPVAPALRLLAHAGAPCPEPLKRAAIDAFGTDAVVEFYGSTEGQFTLCTAADWLERPGTVGRARPGRTMRAVEGQLWCRPPAHARFEYWGEPEKTAAAWDGDWFTLGDLGRVDEDGFVHLEGRRSDLVISGGVNVYPAEVERVLRECDGVDDVCVVGRDDAEWGQRVCASVVGSATEEALRDFAVAHLAPYKRPKAYRHVEVLPLTHSGKVDRPAVAAFWEAATD